MIYLTMFLFVKEGKEKVLHEFEENVIPIIEEYQGKLLYRIRPTDDSFVLLEAEKPYEIHFLTFPSEQCFLDFSKDKKRNEFLYLKEQSVKSILLVKGEVL